MNKVVKSLFVLHYIYDHKEKARDKLYDPSATYILCKVLMLERWGIRRILKRSHDGSLFTCSYLPMGKIDGGKEDYEDGST